MLKHHEESLEILLALMKEKPEVIAVIFSGSVARGNERPDSDLDAMVILTEEAYKRRLHSNTVTECISGMCTYEAGYFDIKYMTKEYLLEAAEKGSEPTRNSFLGSRVLYTADSEIPGIAERIPVFQEQEYEDKMLSFHSNLSLNYNYFWKLCRPEGYMKVHAAGEIIYSVYRMILQQNRILFPCHRRLEDYVEHAPAKPEHITALGGDFIRNMDDASCDRFVQAFQSWTSYKAPEDYSEVLTRYTSDFEQWWRVPRPLIAEW